MLINNSYIAIAFAEKQYIRVNTCV